MTAQMRQIPPPVVSNSLKSVYQTRLRTVGGSCNTLRRSAVQDLRSARNPRGRGRRRDLVDVLRALLPDPQLHRRLGEREFEFLDLIALAALDQADTDSPRNPVENLDAHYGV